MIEKAIARVKKHRRYQNMLPVVNRILPVLASLIASYAFIALFNGHLLVTMLMPAGNAQLAAVLIFLAGIFTSYYIAASYPDNRFNPAELVFIGLAHVAYISTVLVLASSLPLALLAAVVATVAALYYFVYPSVYPLIVKQHTKKIRPWAPSLLLVIGVLLSSTLFLPGLHESFLAYHIQKQSLDRGVEHFAAIKRVPEAEFVSQLTYMYTHWDELSLDQRELELNKVLNFECINVLGIGSLPSMATDKLDERHWALYEVGTNIIRFDNEYLAEASFECALATMLHEVRHAYQYQMKALFARLFVVSPELADASVLRNMVELTLDEHTFDYSEYIDEKHAYLERPYERDAYHYAGLRLYDFYLPAAGATDDEVRTIMTTYYLMRYHEDAVEEWLERLDLL